jgi:hypothetical protein
MLPKYVHLERTRQVDPSRTCCVPFFKKSENGKRKSITTSRVNKSSDLQKLNSHFVRMCRQRLSLLIFFYCHFHHFFIVDVKVVYKKKITGILGKIPSEKSVQFDEVLSPVKIDARILLTPCRLLEILK